MQWLDFVNFVKPTESYDVNVMTEGGKNWFLGMKCDCLTTKNMQENKQEQTVT